MQRYCMLIGETKGLLTQFPKIIALSYHMWTQYTESIFSMFHLTKPLAVTKASKVILVACACSTRLSSFKTTLTLEDAHYSLPSFHSTRGPE